jgi:hypothetical protein
LWKDHLTLDELRKLQNSEVYFKIPFKDVFEVMVEYGILDKSKARLLVEDKGGTYQGENYSSTRIKKMKYFMKNNEFDFDTASASTSDFISMDNIRRISKLLKVRDDISFDLAKTILIEKGMDLRAAQDYGVKSKQKKKNESGLRKFLGDLF